MKPSAIILLLGIFIQCQPDQHSRPISSNDSLAIVSSVWHKMLDHHKKSHATLIDSLAQNAMLWFAMRFTPDPHLPSYIRKKMELITRDEILKLTRPGVTPPPMIYVDTFEHVYADTIAEQMLSSRDYVEYPVLNKIYLVAQPESKREEYLNTSPKSATNFKIGFRYFYPTLTDMDGNIYDRTTLSNKIIIINFWFLGCGPCRAEIPELNKLVSDYKSNPDIVFLAIALDSKHDLVNAMKHISFDYKIISDGHQLLLCENVDLFPTHVVIDKSGKLAFSCSESGKRSVHWIRKTIDMLTSNGR